MKLTPALATTKITAMVAAANGGRLRIYSSTEPATAAEAPAGGNLLLWEDTLAATSYTSVTNGVATMDHSVLSAAGLAAAGAGTVATFFRVYASDATTPLWQGTISDPGGSGELKLGSTTIASGATVSVTSWSCSQPLS